MNPACTHHHLAELHRRLNSSRELRVNQDFWHKQSQERKVMPGVSVDMILFSVSRSCLYTFISFVGHASPLNTKRKQQKREQKKENKMRRDDQPHEAPVLDFDDWIWKKLPLLASAVIQV